MAFRWKNYGDRTPDDYGVVPPSLSEQASVGMRGYVPNSAYGAVNNAPAVSASAAMADYTPNSAFAGGAFEAPQGYGRGMAPENMDVYGQYRDNASREVSEQIRRDELKAKLDDLQAQLEQVNAQIAQIDKEMPGIGSREWEIAAKRAEIGDMSAYDNIMNRGNARLENERNQVSALDKELQTARELTWGLESKDSDNQKIALNKINMALEKAERESARTGRELGVDYYKLREARDNFLAKDNNNPVGPVQNGAEFTSRLTTAIKDKNTANVDKLVEEGERLLKDDPNHPDAATIRAEIEKARPYTSAGIAQGKKDKADAEALYNQIANAPKDRVQSIWNSWTDKQRKLYNRYYSLDSKTWVASKK